MMNSTSELVGFLQNHTSMIASSNLTDLLGLDSSQHPALLNTRAEVVDHLLADQMGTFESPVVNDASEVSTLKVIHDYLLVVLLVSVMFSMGCGVTVVEVWNHLRRPTAVTVCLIAQFFMVPLMAFTMIVGFGLDPLHATGLLILACCPGGVTSNIFTFIADGDLSLSITMTTVATIAAMLLMPLNVFVYGRNLEASNLVIPYFEMTGTLVLVTIPVILGMLLNYHLPNITPYITKMGAFSGFGIIFFCQTLEIFIFPDIFVGVPWSIYAAVIILPPVSFFAGLFFARACRLNEKICRTIGIEIGIKNVGTALTIISLSLTMEQLKKAWVFPILYAFSSFACIFVVIILYKAVLNYQKRTIGEPLPTTDKDQIQAEEDERQVLRKKTSLATTHAKGFSDEELSVERCTTKARPQSKQFNYEKAP